MTTSNLELYEALKKTMNEDAARMIAEVVPAARDLATRADINRLEARIAQSEIRFLRWTLSFFVPLWAAVLATLLVIAFRV